MSSRQHFCVAVVSGAGGAELLALKQKLVQTDKARRQAELKAAAQVKEAEQQVLGLCRPDLCRCMNDITRDRGSG